MERGCTYITIKSKNSVRFLGILRIQSFLFVSLVLSFSWALEVSPQGSVNRSINFREKTPADSKRIDYHM